MSQTPDQHVIDVVLQGDINAFSALVDRYKHMVYTLALRIVKNREDAEEVSQDVFLKAYKALGNFKGDAAFSTWLYKIAYNKSLDYRKKKRRISEPALLPIAEGHTIAVLDDALGRMEDRERKELVIRAVQALPGDDAVVITLFYFEERSLQEIANIMEITSNSAKVRLFRSRGRLAEILKNMLEPETIEKYERS